MSRLWVNGKEVAVPGGRGGQTLLTFLRGELHVHAHGWGSDSSARLPRPTPAGQPPLCAVRPERSLTPRARVRSR